MKNKEKGFTLIELIITMVIVAILSIVSVTGYAIHVENARASEVCPIVHSIIDAQKIYYLENGCYCDCITDLPIEVDGNIVRMSNIGSDGQSRDCIQTQSFAYATWEQKLVKSAYIAFARTGKSASSSGTYWTGIISVHGNKVAWQGHSWFAGSINDHFIRKAVFVKIAKTLCNKDISSILK